MSLNRVLNLNHKKAAALVLAILFGPRLLANTTETLAASDASGYSSINGTANNWIPSTTVMPTNALASTYDYYTSTYTLRTPQDGNSYSIVADSLNIQSGATMSVKGNGTNTFNNLVLAGGSITLASTLGTPVTGYVAGSINLTGNSSIAASSSSSPNRVLYMLATITNSPDVTANLTINWEPATLVLAAQNTFNGNITLNGASTSTVTNSVLQLGVNNAIPVTACLQLSSSSSPSSTVLDLNGYNQTLSNLTFTSGTYVGFVTNSAAGTISTLTLGYNNAAETFGSGFINDAPASNSIIALAKTGNGALTVDSSLNYHGSTMINAGILALGASGSINNSSNIVIAPGAIFDVSALSGYTLSSNQGLTASGTGTTVGGNASAINGPGSGVVELESCPITLTYDGSHPALYIAQGTLALVGNSFSVNTTSPLAEGSYVIIQQASGGVENGGTFSVSGTAIGGGMSGTISISGGNVFLIISSGGNNTVTTCSLSGGSNPSTYGSSVSFTAIVTGTGTPTGNVIFKDGITPLSTNALINGTASFTTTALTAGSYSIAAYYQGDGNHAASNSSANPLNETVNPATVNIISGITANSKIYDGTTTATINSNNVFLSGILTADMGKVSLSTNNYIANFDSTSSGSNITVMVSGLALVGSASGNYTLIQPVLSASILPGLNEYQLVINMPPATMNLNTGGTPDSNGLVGANSPGGSSPLYPSYPYFTADEQRGAIDTMVVGIAETNDGYVAQGYSAINATYNLQTSAGDFSTNATYISSPGCPTSDMRFFMAYTCHALELLMQSPYMNKVPPNSSQTYGAWVTNIFPKIQSAMNYIAKYGTCNGSSGISQSWGDFNSPNRTLINAAAFAFGDLVLQGYSSQATINSYWTNAQAWLNNEFVSSNSVNANPPAPLWRSFDGVFIEAPGCTPAHYGGNDTSYQAVADRFFSYILCYFPNCENNAISNCMTAGRFLERRVYNGYIDDTYNTRSGPDNEDCECGNLCKSDDLLSERFTLMYYAAMFNRPEGNIAAAALRNALATNGLPPVIFSWTNASIATGQPFSFTVLASNAGKDALDTNNFTLSAVGLPPGLSLSTNITYNKSTGSKVISGTPTNAGVYVVSLTGHNAFGTGATATLTITITSNPPPSLSISCQGTNLVVSWPLSASNYVLQKASSLVSPVNWLQVSDPFITNPPNIQVDLVPQRGTNIFYRLAHP
jgi:autotransporter-associated beta strand protein